MFHSQIVKKNKTYNQCARLVGLAVQRRWFEAEKSTILLKNIVKKILNFHKVYTLLQKSKGVQSGGAYQKRLATLKREVGNLFDVSNGQQQLPATLPSNPDYKRDVVGQAARADASVTGTGLITARRKRSRATEASSTGIKLEGTDSSTDSDTDFVLDCNDNYASCFVKKEELATPISTSQVCGYLDKGGCSTRSAFRTVASVVAASKRPVKSARCSRSTIWRRRVQERIAKARKVRENFKLHKGKVLTAHWDGIKVAPLVGGSRRKLVERLPVQVTGIGVNQFLSSRVIASGSVEHTAAEVLRALEDWGCADDVVALCSDTPTGNTGYKNGAAGLIEKGLGRELLYMACRHHVLELIPKGLFDKLVEKSTSPDIGSLCKQLQEQWDGMNHAAFLPATQDPDCQEFLADRSADILAFVSEQLQKEHTRADYRQLLELSAIILGENPFKPKSIKFRPPIAVTSARFMGRIIYCLTIHMFALTGEFPIAKEKLDNIKKVNMFVLSSYLQPWYTAGRPASAPATDLRLLKNIVGYTQCPEVAEIASSVFKNHLWYLHRVCVCLAFFDEDIPAKEKKTMVDRLQVSPPVKVSPWKRHWLPAKQHLSSLKDASLSSFINKDTMDFFKILRIETSFLQEDPSTWPDNESYKQGMEKVQALQCVNDVAERGVALVKRFTKDSLTKSDDHFQDLLVAQSEILLEEKHSSASLTLAHYGNKIFMT
ncbi:Zinc finger and BTB domain-containing protein 1 [Frankliniella fusca]|uniref:Zinc finger and BTB domain-containing protein 1 n=1 Tax=Frankliniella fusca TaxID=407009 RepID=A0AAE1LNL7_9NEOP|nr:Zinc finger and BTB domain-containing protein 1 [Frankliniella fusca]